MKYVLRESGGITFIRDQFPQNKSDIFVYGPMTLHRVRGGHRGRYSQADAQATVDWLNERAALYPARDPSRTVVQAHID